ncbi:MAG TPA: trehalose-6-phosphate synthase [Ktedonobacterales bacterium]
MPAYPAPTPHANTTHQLASLTAGHRVIVASNRGPVEFYYARDGHLATKRGAGGVVTALAALARDVPLTWVATTMTAADREAFSEAQASARTVRIGHQPLQVRYVPVPPEMYRRYYDEISNEILWFLQHYMWNPIRWPTFTKEHVHSWDEGYRSVNEAIARAIVDVALSGARHQQPDPLVRAEHASEGGANSIVMLQDYQLYLVSALVRARLPRATIEQFIHIPWPANRYWEFLPSRFVHEIYEGLAGNDVLGFQTVSDMRNFLVGARAFLAGSRVDFDRQTVVWRRHRLLVRVYPIPTDASEIRRTLLLAPARAGARELGDLLGDKRQVIMRVDRLDPSKNIVRGFLAYETLLRRWPELREQVHFLAFLIPSRQSLPIYRAYQREVRDVIRRINTQYRTEDWQPIVAFFENNRPRALAAMRRYDVLLVNSIIDGMNLVAKEGPAVNERHGVLVLSRTAGAFEQLAEVALPITPTDIDETATELYEALHMSDHERTRRAEQAQAIVEAETPVDWMLAQLRDALAQRRAPSRHPSPRTRQAQDVPVS